MDFVVVGLGLGTLGILTGLSLLTWVAGRWERSAARAGVPELAAYDASVAASRRSAGQAFAGAGAAVLIATIAALAGSLDDQTGAYFVATAATVAGLGLLFWAYLHRSRNPLPARLRPGSEAVAVPGPDIAEARDPLPDIAPPHVAVFPVAEVEAEAWLPDAAVPPNGVEPGAEVGADVDVPGEPATAHDERDAIALDTQATEASRNGASDDPSPLPAEERGFTRDRDT